VVETAVTACIIHSKTGELGKEQNSHKNLCLVVLLVLFVAARINTSRMRVHDTYIMVNWEKVFVLK
jgi:hypothetical protein